MLNGSEPHKLTRWFTHLLLLCTRLGRTRNAPEKGEPNASSWCQFTLAATDSKNNLKKLNTFSDWHRLRSQTPDDEGVKDFAK